MFPSVLEDAPQAQGGMSNADPDRARRQTMPMMSRLSVMPALQFIHPGKDNSRSAIQHIKKTPPEAGQSVIAPSGDGSTADY